MIRAPKFWFSSSLFSKVLAWILWPISLVYQLAFKFNFWRKKAFSANIPVICVGNLVAGGAGKTPCVLWLAEQLIKVGHEPHIILRGYGGSQKQTYRVCINDDATKVGDEALLYAHQSLPTWVGGDRVSSAKEAQNAGATVILMDDGFQNPSLFKNFSLLVIDKKTLVGNGFTLPAGPLRETLASALSRCQMVFLMDASPNPNAEISSVPDWFQSYKKPLFHVSLKMFDDDKEWVKDKNLVAFSGIGRPKKFFDTLIQNGANVVETYSYPDHHFYGDHELEFLMQRVLQASTADDQFHLVTTTKDHVRLPRKMKERCRAIKVSLHAPNESECTQLLLNSIKPQ